jgi:hypothetical protein
MLFFSLNSFAQIDAHDSKYIFEMDSKIEASWKKIEKK